MTILGGLDLINFVQWPAMAVTIAASWLVASSNRERRNSGFWLFLLSNGLWVVWALHVNAPALIALQVGLAAMNIRGAMKSGFG
jgi:hypothetical protein